MKRKLSRIRRTWRRLFITLTVTVLWLTNQLTSPRARVHWVGYRRRVRPQRFMTIFVFFAAMFLLEPRDYATWAAIWGGVTSILVSLYSVYWLIHQ